MSLGFLQLGLAVVLCLFIVARHRAMSFALFGLQTLSAGALAVQVAGAAEGNISDDAFAIAAAPVVLGALAVWATRFPAPSGPRTRASASP
jgi:hypothetical protein